MKLGEPFRCALLDPPWQQRGGGKIKRGADRHYDLLSRQEILRVVIGASFDPLLWQPLWDLVSRDAAHVWCWVPDNHLADGLWLLDALDVRFVRTCVWIKDRFGLGQYLRGQHELLLFGVRGRGKDESVWAGRRDVPSVFHARKGRHSEKPAESYELIESISKGPRLELFARSERPGWVSWGDEAPLMAEGVVDG